MDSIVEIMWTSKAGKHLVLVSVGTPGCEILVEVRLLSRCLVVVPEIGRPVLSLLILLAL